ncbi:transporter substrate-binding domain-containing protein [Microtetraspora sp. NBRC 16547]|uniref:transporter substrate-binding domain-containing protein n=1 Tax=Microtetraspora sp. NBRC 16547 TaxID=3030993 RepID=UPI0024A5B3B7|nr:transporter substrate-binding domain-containing protein [Microtetraspora sp. NBRC 16547]GLX01569.1 basic amino acid ABC transporter substrate-binding protein [Microtetraspora sp. NBRC 16547]
MAPWPMRRRMLSIGAAALVTAFAVSACGGSTGGGTKGGVPLVNAERLTTCTHLQYEPFEFNQGAKIVGFDIDIIDLVARKLGVKQDVIDIDFAAIKSGAVLNSGRCDVAAAGMTINDERSRNLEFSVPYFDATQALLAKKGSGLTSLGDVKAKHLKLGAQASTTGLQYVKGKGFDPIEFADSPKELLGMETGQADVVVQDLPVALTWLNKPEIRAKYEVIANLDTGEQYGIGMKKGNTALSKVVNEVIETAKADGTYTAIYKKWFGTEPSPAASS